MKPLLHLLPPLHLLPLLLLPSLSWAAGFGTHSIGTSSGDFLELGAGARAAAMGEAAAAVSDDASALYWNPAAMTRIKGRSTLFMHAPHFDSSHYDYLAYARGHGTDKAWGAGIQYYSAGGITERDSSGASLGAFTPWDLALSGGYAVRVEDTALSGFTFGLTGKYIYSKVKDSAHTVAVDLGALSPKYLDGRLGLAFTARNIGTDLRYEKESEVLPLAFKFGGVYQISARWLVALDLGLPRGNAPFTALGTEYLFSAGKGVDIAGRFGFNSRTVGDISGFNGFSLGFGILYRQARFDYALVPLGSLSLAHRVSLGYDF